MLGHALVNAMFVPDHETGLMFVANHMVFLNGRVVQTANTTLALGDFVQLLITTSYYITHR